MIAHVEINLDFDSLMTVINSAFVLDLDLHLIMILILYRKLDSFSKFQIISSFVTDFNLRTSTILGFLKHSRM